MEEIGEEREKKPIISFDDIDKELVVNVTNWDTIEGLTGEYDSDKWTGHVIKLVRVRVHLVARTSKRFALNLLIQNHSGVCPPKQNQPKRKKPN